MKLLKFGAEWCGPCKTMRAVVEKALGKFPSLEFEDIDVEDNIKLTEQYNIKNVPTFIIIDKNKNEIARTSGSLTQTKFEEWLQTNI